MTTLSGIDPNTFIDPAKSLPANGRGAWTKTGIGFDTRYALADDPTQRIGTLAQKSLDHWAVAAGAYAIQKRLITLGHMTPLADSERGIFGPRTETAVKAFQAANRDPDGGAQLAVDGIVGRSDARSLFTPIAAAAEAKYSIPGRLLIGETNHESALDPGAVGYFIYYPDFRGVDRGMSQINSDANTTVTWVQAYDPVFSLDWSGKRLRTHYDTYKARYPTQSAAVLWDAAVCAHNNPWAAGKWAAAGGPPTDDAATYVAAVRAAIY